MPYDIEYSPDTGEHLKALTARQRTTVQDEIDRQLRFEPDVKARNRKPMRPNRLAPWELRVGNLRVYYDVEEKSKTVVILAVGIKKGNSVVVGKETIEL